MKEILKQLPNGDWMHDYWVDENGNRIEEPYNTPQELMSIKFKYLSDCRDADIYKTFVYNGNKFDCDKEARSNIDDLVFAQQHDPSFAGRIWNLSGGEGYVMLMSEDVIPFKTESVKVKDNAWAKFAMLAGQLQMIDLNSPDAIELINAIVW